MTGTTMTTGHGAITLEPQACTSCMICARECPAWCITIDSHTEPVPDLPPGARARTHNVLDTFIIDWSLCMFCGICIEECPFDALAWNDHHAAPSGDLAGLLHGIDQLTALAPAETEPETGSA